MRSEVRSQKSANNSVLPSELPYSFHDAGIIDIRIGPRREVTLIVDLDDPNYPPHKRVFIRFGGITNLAEVSTFLGEVPPEKSDDAYRARIERFDYDTKEQSKSHNLIFQLALDMLGHVQIRCQNVMVEPDG